MDHLHHYSLLQVSILFLLYAGEFIGWPVAGVDDGGLDVILVHCNDLGRFRRDIEDTVVVGIGLRRGAAFEISDRSADGVSHQGADILQDGHGLLAVDDVLDGSDLCILSGDHVAGDICIGGEGVSDGAGGAVIGGQDEHIALVCGGGGGQVGLGQVLGGVEIPVGGDLADDLAHARRGSVPPCPAGQPLRWSS